MQKKSRAFHKAVATKNWTEAESLILPTRSVSLEDALIRLDQLHKNLARKQNFLGDLNSKIQAKFDNQEVYLGTFNSWSRTADLRRPQEVSRCQMPGPGSSYPLNADNFNTTPLCNSSEQSTFTIIPTQLQHQRRNIRSQMRVLQWHSQATPLPELYGSHCPLSGGICQIEKNSASIA